MGGLGLPTQRVQRRTHALPDVADGPSGGRDLRQLDLGLGREGVGDILVAAAGFVGEETGDPGAEVGTTDGGCL